MDTANAFAKEHEKDTKEPEKAPEEFTIDDAGEYEKDTKEPTKGTAKEPAVKENAKEPEKGNAKEPVKGNAKEPAKGNTKESAKGNVKEAVLKGNVKESAKGTAKEPTKRTAKEPTKGTVKESAKGTAKEPTKGTAKEPAKRNAKEPKEPVKRNAKESVKGNVKEKENTKKSVKRTAKEYAIEVSDLKIRYKCLNRISIKNSLFSLKKSEVDVFEAVKGISFKVPRGEIMGIVGKNGSGKSTMLRAIAGIFAADEGTIDLHGHTVSLLSIGVGFQKKLTGRENIFLSGMLLGFREEQILGKLDDIIEFSELEGFIDKPVRTYSSGMYSKLAFSITAILETEIMLIDEVLSVGDVRFKKKSYAKMKELITNEERTVMIVSHSTETLEKLCDTVLWLHEGKIKMQGSTSEVLPLYNDYMS